MVFKKPGNSRDDKSRNTSGRRAGSGNNPSSASSSRTRNSSSSFKKSDSNAPRKRFAEEGDKKPFSSSRRTTSGGSNAEDKSKGSFGDRKSFSSRGGNDNRGGEGKFRSSGTERSFKGTKSSSFKSRPEGNEESRDKRFSKPDRQNREGGFGNKPYRERSKPQRASESFKSEEFTEERPAKIMRGRKKPAEADDKHLIRLNRYISNAGICSRRKADELIIAGVVSVNGEVVSELGHKVDPAKDVIRYNGETLKREKMVYVLLNKPKDYITTTDDPQERRTVMHLVEKASRERIYPVGRLDRNTTGLLLMTNDGELADKLSHPRNNITKIYQIELNKNLTQGDLNKISFGLELEDGLIKPDMVTYVQGGTKREIGIQIHSGKNRIVRRIFEHLGYEVVKLDRAVYANLTKKDLPRGRWRYLDEKEIIQLKHLIQ
ncbi:pseudouridine synthase [Mucilaginibacter robiniae]|uniref:Pseudouridine synthase n=1 Tax=Mucilaginibacter robiniae TaxID=2728022 RepID=A0A7L5E082_9SPHI|nr:pseudouridine synthase [Mucilaginibacter robiniae]QJD95689.1 pseudouridine synthase [Mucilaginibacter robiniae]